MVFLLGAGKSAIYLIENLDAYLNKIGSKLVVLDLHIHASLPMQFPNVHFIEGALNSETATEQFKQCKVVVSFLPANMHIWVAKKCLEFNKHLVTASYATEEINNLSDVARAQGLSFLFELGLDPGIDHMSAMEMTQRLQKEGHTISSFKSYCGALIAPVSDTNPWHYKFTWNPMNVVLAAQNLAGYINNGKQKYMNPRQIFAEHIKVKTPSGIFDGYYNRDSISYQEKYKLENCDTFIRGTLRGDGFCEAWQVLVDLGLTHHGTEMNVENRSIKEVISSLIFEHHLSNDFWQSIQKQVGGFSAKTLVALKYLALDSDKILPLTTATPAEYLLEILKPKWQLEATDKDRIVLWHEVITTKNDQTHTFNAVLDLEGESENRTAIAKTVSLPAAFAAQLLLEDQVKSKGVQIPVIEELYIPILERLATAGIKMYEF